MTECVIEKFETYRVSILCKKEDVEKSKAIIQNAMSSLNLLGSIRYTPDAKDHNIASVFVEFPDFGIMDSLQRKIREHKA